MKLKWIGALGVILLAWVFAGCVTTHPPSPQTPCALDELRLGDNVVMNFTDIPQPGFPEQRVRVKDDGTLTLPMNLSVVAAGKKIGVVEKEIRALFVPKLYNQLTVTIKTDDRFYFVGGEVKSPSRQIYLGETTVLRAIQSCGDFSDFANRRKVEVLRADGRREIVDCKKARKDPRYDAIICPGDAIHIPRRGV